MDTPTVTELLTKREIETRNNLLQSRGLKPIAGADLILGCWSVSGTLVATGSLKGNILQGLAVDEQSEGQGLAAVVVSALINEAMRLNRTHLFLFTKPNEAASFASLGFSRIARTTHVALLEWGRPNLEDWIASIKPLAKPFSGCIVMNANPFTLGHRHLVEQAAKSGPVFVLVVEEEASLFPYAVRLALVEQGVADLSGVRVIPGGAYTISMATFPGYFLKDDTMQAAHAGLDIEIFRNYVAPALGISQRFVGTEPLCGTTDAYNDALKALLPISGIRLVEVPRLVLNDVTVSASFVRDAIHKNRMDEIQPFVPVTTWKYLHSPEAVPVIERIRKTVSRH